MLTLAERSDAIASPTLLANTSVSASVSRAPLSGTRSVEMNRATETIVITPALMDVDEGASLAFWRKVPQNSHALPDAFATTTRMRSSMLYVPLESWVKTLYDDSRGKVTQNQIVRLFDALEVAIYSDVDRLDTTIGMIEVRRLAPEFMVGIPRALFPLKDHLFNWRPFVLKVWNELSRRNLDVRELLQGLL